MTFITFIKDALNWYKSDSDNIYNIAKDSISNKSCPFELFDHQRILKNKMYHGFQENNEHWL